MTGRRRGVAPFGQFPANRPQPLELRMSEFLPYGFAPVFKICSVSANFSVVLSHKFPDDDASSLPFIKSTLRAVSLMKQL